MWILVNFYGLGSFSKKFQLFLYMKMHPYWSDSFANTMIQGLEPGTMTGENRQLVTHEPVEFEK